MKPIERRNYEDEPFLLGGDHNEVMSCFRGHLYDTINKARLDHLASLELDLEQKKVLDLGCGIGDLAQFFVERNCDVVCVDGHDRNIHTLRTLYPDLKAHIVDVETGYIEQWGEFEVTFCYGLLYHLESPIMVLRKIARVTTGMLLLSTRVCDSKKRMAILRDERKTAVASLGGMSLILSPSALTTALNRVGFDYVYTPTIPPDHSHFKFERKNDSRLAREGTAFRMMFVASHHPLDNPALTSLLKNKED